MRAYYLVSICVACGGGGNDERLSALTVAQAVQLCDQIAAMYPQKTVSCGGSAGTVTVGFAGSADCTAGSNTTTGVPASCTATVGDAESCAAAEYDDPCHTNPAGDAATCAAFLACFAGSGSA
jgi:hypothetical protein